MVVPKYQNSPGRVLADMIVVIYPYIDRMLPMSQIVDTTYVDKSLQADEKKYYELLYLF